MKLNSKAQAHKKDSAINLQHNIATNFTAMERRILSRVERLVDHKLKSTNSEFSKMAARISAQAHKSNIKRFMGGINISEAAGSFKPSHRQLLRGLYTELTRYLSGSL